MADPLKQLALLREKLEMQEKVRNDLEKRVLHTVAGARTDGASWRAIGEALGTTRQAAWERFGKPE